MRSSDAASRPVKLQLHTNMESVCRDQASGENLYYTIIG
jgi:hypothetical protein